VHASTRRQAGPLRRGPHRKRGAQPTPAPPVARVAQRSRAAVFLRRD
jgi:hypothetical protein